LGKIGALADHDFVLFGLELLLENGQSHLFPSTLIRERA
jgi:hypothetical protein